MSLPSRECGLKCIQLTSLRKSQLVTPLAGVWIEMSVDEREEAAGDCHSPRGSVD